MIMMIGDLSDTKVTSFQAEPDEKFVNNLLLPKCSTLNNAHV